MYSRQLLLHPCGGRRPQKPFTDAKIVGYRQVKLDQNF